ncbi:hypothetical protein C2G38_2172968 [Gigaspora rosea]|uniref:BACK domain-containing protein n=1 Tax=Gigaspora rosea TaxID=44941 RepID=A0A397VNE3_9GLOM|nr:hypothetical protein C2G38_2172968 [Gigaspora rosea]
MSAKFLEHDFSQLLESEYDYNVVIEKSISNTFKRDDLQVEEIEIWEKVIQWGKAQTQDLPSDLGQWIDENFMTLKTTLHNCLPLIRYLQIPVNDILTKDDITAKFMTSDAVITSNILPACKKLSIQLPAREPSIESCIINEEHAAEISSWIDRHSSPYYVTNIPYKFKLLLRGSRDDFTIESFHRLCDNIPRTVVIIKVDADSFIFPLKTNNLSSSILSRVKNIECAIGCSSTKAQCIELDQDSLLLSGILNIEFIDSQIKNDLMKKILWNNVKKPLSLKTLPPKLETFINDRIDNSNCLIPDDVDQELFIKTGQLIDSIKRVWRMNMVQSCSDMFNEASWSHSL